MLKIMKKMSGLGLLFILIYANSASADIVTGVTFKSPSFAGDMITAEIKGFLPNSCTLIESVRVEREPTLRLHSNVNLHLETRQSSEVCLENAQPFSQSVIVGKLDYGLHKVQVFIDASLALVTDIVTPEDIMPLEFDFFEEPTIIENDRTRLSMNER